MFVHVQSPLLILPHRVLLVQELRPSIQKSQNSPLPYAWSRGYSFVKTYLRDRNHEPLCRVQCRVSFCRYFAYSSSNCNRRRLCMKDVIPYYKNRGETPKEALERLRIERPKLQNETLSYAGRLDPLAEGGLLILVGEANKEREQYLHLSKKYTVEILFGWST